MAMINDHLPTTRHVIFDGTFFFPFSQASDVASFSNKSNSLNSSNLSLLLPTAATPQSNEHIGNTSITALSVVNEEVGLSNTTAVISNVNNETTAYVPVVENSCDIMETNVTNHSNIGTSVGTNSSVNTSVVGATSNISENFVGVSNSTQNTHSIQTRSKSGISKKKLFVAHVQTPLTESSCFTKASKLKEWQKAMREEFEALLHQNTGDSNYFFTT